MQQSSEEVCNVIRHVDHFCVEVTAGGGKKLRGKRPPLQVYILNTLDMEKLHHIKSLTRKGNFYKRK